MVTSDFRRGGFKGGGNRDGGRGLRCGVCGATARKDAGNKEREQGAIGHARRVGSVWEGCQVPFRRPHLHHRIEGVASPNVIFQHASVPRIASPRDVASLVITPRSGRTRAAHQREASLAIIAAFDLCKCIVATDKPRHVASANDLTNADDNSRTRLHTRWCKRIARTFSNFVPFAARWFEAVIVVARLKRMTVFCARLATIKITRITFVSIATNGHDPSKQCQAKHFQT